VILLRRPPALTLLRIRRLITPRLTLHRLRQSCVKLNNIETARTELDRMYEKMHVDEVTKLISSVPPQPPAKDSASRFLFTVKIVLAEGLVPHDRSSSAKLDTFVTLSDQHGQRLAKTRTVYESLDPRCESPSWSNALRDAAWQMLNYFLQGSKRLTSRSKRACG
jgi:hypothetical protein